MQDLNDLDLLHFKYMVISTELLNQDEVKNIDNYKQVLDLMTENCGEHVCKELVNEALYNLKFNSQILQNGTCPSIYEKDSFQPNFTNESIFLVKLFHNLNVEEAFYVLQRYFDISEDQYRGLELNLESINLTKSLPEVEKWLTDKNEGFRHTISNFLQNTSWKIADVIPKPNYQVDCVIPKTKYKGICLVISNYNVKNHEVRKGTEVDERNIKETFEAEGFYVRIYRDVTWADMMNRVVKEIKSEIRKSDKAIVIFVMSHGKDGVIITSDGMKFELENLYKAFYNEECPELFGKPKLFFIVSCQGAQINLASKKVIYDKDSIIETDTMANCFPKVSDVFYGYATYKEFVSYRGSVKGTFYVNSLCKAIKENKTGSIHDIHELVNEEVQRIDKAKGFQTPYYSTMLGPKNKFIFDRKPK